MKPGATSPTAPAPGEKLARTISGNCATYRNLSRPVRAELWRICAVLPDLVDAPLLLPACRAAAPGLRLTVKATYERLRSFLNSQSWLALLDRRASGPAVWKSKKAGKVSASLAAVMRAPRVKQGLLTSLSEAEQHELVALLASGMTMQAVAERVKQNFGVRTTLAALRRFRLNARAGRIGQSKPVELRIEIFVNGQKAFMHGGKQRK
jgi:chromosome condensin MukBEF MukE localization factor